MQQPHQLAHVRAWAAEVRLVGGASLVVRIIERPVSIATVV